MAHAKTRQDDFWHTLLDEQWRDRATGHTDVDATAHMFVNAYSISTGEHLRGERAYRIDLPVDPPVNLFWSVTLYDAETAPGLALPGQTYPSLNSMNDLTRNDDGSVTLWIGPDGSLTLTAGSRPPAGDRERNRLPAPQVPFSLYLRAYWGRQAILDGSWQPPAVRRTS
ncbi:DUF1214 domain-containing protein [Catellatospora aurea]|uniref:DUF1214 domain-containing protein n=1 Tax=Catellatospora aurea TaxID=1337874 RepID=A0ABW2H7T1_9ACTN